MISVWVIVPAVGMTEWLEIHLFVYILLHIKESPWTSLSIFLTIVAEL